jgi:recombination protein RecA
MKIGVMFGSPETTSGGNALKFYSTVRMDIRRIGAIKEGDVVSGNRTKVKVVKNKVAPPFRIAEFDIIYGEGISYEGDMIDLGSDSDIIKKSGTWYSYGAERLGQGKEAARKFLKNNPKIRDEVDKKIRLAFGIGPAADAVGGGTVKTGSTAAGDVEKVSAPKISVPPAVVSAKGRPGAQVPKK